MVKYIYKSKIHFCAAKLHLSFLIIILLFLQSCKKYLEVEDPRDRVATNSIFKDDNTAVSAVIGIYSNIMQNPSLFSFVLSGYGGLLSDELSNTGSTPTILLFQNNQLDPTNVEVNNYWAHAYFLIYSANSIIGGLESNESSVTPAVRSQLLGEAKFVRALTYFYLVNLFGDVPLILGTDYKTNAVLPRTSEQEVYGQIIVDAKDAKELLSSSYASGDKVRPNKWTAAAFLARVYLYRGDWAKAEEEAGAVISSGSYTPLPVPGAAFTKGSKEIIWQIMPVNLSYNTYEGRFFIPANSTTVPNYILNTTLTNAFQSADLRKTSWIGTNTVNSKKYSFPAKYKIGNNASLNEYNIVFRAAEQFLIRSEARANQNKLGDAAVDLNVVRTRAGLATLPAGLSQNQVLDSVMKERRVELFAEWGHRWFDLKRTNQLDAVIGAFKASTWKINYRLWPIPQMQRDRNTLLGQNDGY